MPILYGPIRACAPSIHALRVLRCYGLNDTALQIAYRAIIVARLTYASSAWWGFTTADDRRRIEGFLRRGIRAGFYLPSWPTVENLVEDADDVLFSRVLNNKNHVLYPLFCLNSISSSLLKTRFSTRFSTRF